MMKQPEPVSVFLSYAQEDEQLCQKLVKHLILLQRQKLISMWHNQKIQPGTNRAEAIDEQLEHAPIILLLISADFLASDYCYSIEMMRALEQHNTQKVRVIPIIIRSCDWSNAPFASLQCLPHDGKAITTWPDQDLAFKQITIELRNIVEELQKRQIHIPLSQEDLIQNSLINRIDEHINTQIEHIFPYILQELPKFRRCQKKVSELKSVHNMLHEIEIQLEGLSATIQLAIRYRKEEKKISQFLPDFDCIETVWQQTTMKIDDLTYFASQVVEELEDERFNFDSHTIRGAPWVKDLFILERSFEVEMRNRNINMLKNLSNELLTKCRIHLYRIDKRLLAAVKELDASSDLIIKGRI